MTSVSLRKRLAGTVLGLVFTALILVWITSDWALHRLQSAKYGTPITACVGKVGVTLNENWLFEVIVEESDTLPLLFGLYPVPKFFTSVKTDARLVVVRSIVGATSVSIHPDSQVISSVELVENCSKNSACSLATSRFNASAKVALVKTGDAIWETYLNSPVMIGIHGGTPVEPQGIRVFTCAEKQLDKSKQRDSLKLQGRLLRIAAPNL